MTTSSRIIVFSVIASITGYIGYYTYQYFFDMTPPNIKIVGIDNESWYAGDITAHLIGKDNYKIDHFSIWLDNKPIVSEFSVRKKEFNYPLSIPVQNIQDGMHHVKIEVVDSTYHKNTTTIHRTFNTDNVPLHAALVKTEDYKAFQGKCIHIQFQVNKPIHKAILKTCAQEFYCFPEEKNSTIYETFIPVECETTPNEYLFSIDITDKVGNTFVLENKFQVIAFPFKKRTLNVEDSKLEEEAQATQLTQAEFEAKMIQLTKDSVQEKLWKGVFYIPLDMTGMVTEFGVMRTNQQKGRYAHKAVDLIGLLHCVVWACQDGIVVLKDRYQHSGNTVVIDHGYGILSMYFHLDDFSAIQVGDKIQKGRPLGKMGKTGFANGHHLHWELRVQNIAVDPMQWTKKDFF